MIAELEKNIQEIIAAEMGAYIVRCSDLIWRVKRYIDGETVTQDCDRIEAAIRAERMGYYIRY